MSQQAPYLWTPIEDLPANAATLASPETAALVAAWREYAQTLKNNEAYERFLAQLRRQWAIETGIIERLYSLSEGATKTLIEKGLDEALISHGDTDRPPAQVIAMINDQYHAIEGLYQFISGNRPLGTSYIKELHRVLTNNQLRYDAIDTLGNRVERDLPRGQWKKLPNNVEGPDGFVFQFCPPEHVDTEMERLLQLHEQHEREGIPPDVEAAWLHHRFTLIHPFTDGNGRVARCLATLVLLKANWFPLVVTRDDRADYIFALRVADKGNLANLVQLFDSVQDRSIRQALSISATSSQHAIKVNEILAAVSNRMALQPDELAEKHQQVIIIANALYARMVDRFNEIAREAEASIKTSSPNFRAYVNEASHLDKMAHEHDEVIWDIADQVGYRPATGTYDAWGLLVLEGDFRIGTLVSIHGIGEHTGVLMCSGIAARWFDRGYPIEPVALSQKPFHFTYLEAPATVLERFETWLDEIIIAGLNYWRNAIGA